jgi:hypothetical protein
MGDREGGTLIGEVQEFGEGERKAERHPPGLKPISFFEARVVAQLKPRSFKAMQRFEVSSQEIMTMGVCHQREKP